MPSSKARVIVQEYEVGAGAFAVVYAASEDATGAVFAYKKARTSSRVKRPLLRHEARVLQLIQGHRAVPTLIGYERKAHFEQIAMELLGGHLGRFFEKGHAVNPTTVLRIGEQMISALQHVHAHNIIHRDIKPGNILVALDDPARICLVDYGLARRLSPEEMTTPPTKRYDPLESGKCIIGSVDWCSLNAHEGIDLRPRDDVESLAYTLFWLALGSLPWRVDYECEHNGEQYSRVQGAKKAFAAMLPLPGIPAPLTDLLRIAQASRGDGDIVAALQCVRESFRRNIDRSGEPDNAALDWKPVPVPASAPPLMPIERKQRPEESTKEGKVGRALGKHSNSYRGRWHRGMVRVPSRSPSLTFPGDEAELLDAHIPSDIHINDSDSD